MHGVLVELLSWLDSQGFSFVTVAPETHRRVLARRADTTAKDLRDVFGWSLPFEGSQIPSELLVELNRFGLACPDDHGWRLALRASTVHGRLFLHSAYPTDAKEAVFLGPDSYRFADCILRETTGRKPDACLDIGTGAGVGAILAAGALRPSRMVATDVNPFALTLARANADFAGLPIEMTLAADARQLDGAFDLIVANPPFIDDPQQLTYRSGGRLGVEAAVSWAEQALAKLASGGLFLLYSGAAIVAGRDRLKADLGRLCAANEAGLSYREIDPDIFSEQLAAPEYAEVERIAAICARIERS